MLARLPRREHGAAVQPLELTALGQHVQVATDGGLADAQRPGELDHRLPAAAERSQDPFVALGEEHAGDPTQT